MAFLTPKAMLLPGGTGSGGLPRRAGPAPGCGACAWCCCVWRARLRPLPRRSAEYQIKAAYLLNFARYVEWPAARLSATQPLRVCVLGRDPFGGALVGLEGRQVNGREVRVRQLEGVDQAGGVPHRLHLRFRRTSGGRAAAAAVQPGLLLVSDIDGFAEAGGSIGLVTEEGRVRFEINQASLLRDGLRASAQLLRLARSVYGVRAP